MCRFSQRIFKKLLEKNLFVFSQLLLQHEILKQKILKKKSVLVQHLRLF
jgi:hypothetical protein